CSSDHVAASPIVIFGCWPTNRRWKTKTLAPSRRIRSLSPGAAASAMVSSTLPADTFMVSTIVCVSFIGFRMGLSPPLSGLSRVSTACSPGSWGTPGEHLTVFYYHLLSLPLGVYSEKRADCKRHYRSLFPTIIRALYGGVWGLERGYCMMVGGPKATVDRLDPLFKALAPGLGNVPRTAGRDGRDQRAELGYLHCGPSGAGHFVKMIHNGIEYGPMQAFAEGFGMLQHGNSQSLPDDP